MENLKCLRTLFYGKQEIYKKNISFWCLFSTDYWQKLIRVHKFARNNFSNYCFQIIVFETLGLNTYWQNITHVT